MMVIKSFQAGSIQEALDKVRTEFGKDAVIIRTDVIHAGGGRLFTVTAARDPQSHPRPQRVTPKQDPTANATTFSVAGKDSASAGTGRGLESALLDVVLPELLHGELKNIYLRLRTNEVETRTALDICRALQATQDCSEQRLAEVICAILPESIELPEPDRPIVLIGPCGAGKSTLLARLAAELVFKRKQKVTLRTLDNFRPGAREEIATISEILELGSDRSASQPERSYQLIDTTGLVLNDQNAVTDLQRTLEQLSAPFVVLVFSLTSGWRTMRRFLDATRPLSVDALALTQLDAADCCGAVINLASSACPPLLCVSDSRIPSGGLMQLNVESIMPKLIGRGDD